MNKSYIQIMKIEANASIIIIFGFIQNAWCKLYNLGLIDFFSPYPWGFSFVCLFQILWPQTIHHIILSPSTICMLIHHRMYITNMHHMTTFLFNLFHNIFNALSNPPPTLLSMLFEQHVLNVNMTIKALRM
jgi:hypothetical protein